MSRKALFSLLNTITVALVGLFFVQALRRLPGLLINFSDGAALPAGAASDSEATLAGAASSGRLGELVIIVLLSLALPWLAQRFSRAPLALPLSVMFIAAARLLPLLNTGLPESLQVAPVLWGGLVYIVLIMQQSVMQFPQLMILGFAADQLVRAAGHTLDISWTPAWVGPQLLLSALAIAPGVYLARRFQKSILAEVTAQQGLLTLWGAVGLGALLYLELSLLALPHAIAARSATAPELIAPLLMVATLLPLLPPVRGLAQSLPQVFYGGLRGWLWMALLALLLVAGLRLEGLPAAMALVVMQFAVSLMWWFLLRPQEKEDRDLGALALLPALLLTALLLLGSYFTVAVPLDESAFPGLANAGELVQRMLRGLRGMGPALLLLAVFLAALPMTRTRPRVAWAERATGNGLVAILAALAVTVLAVGLTRPPLPAAALDSATLRVATWNIDAGADQRRQHDLERFARTIERSGADIVLLQNVDAGRSTSYWVDQAYWLARRLNMQHRFFPTAEGVNGLALLARGQLGAHDGRLAVGDGQQGGLQRAGIEVQGETLTLYNYWSGQAPRNIDLQIGAMNSLISDLHRAGVPERLVLGASFSEAPDEQLLLPLGALMDLVDPFYGQPSAGVWTTRRDGVATRSDFLWLRTPLRGTGTGVTGDEAARHRLAVLEFSLDAGVR